MSNLSLHFSSTRTPLPRSLSQANHSDQPFALCAPVRASIPIILFLLGSGQRLRLLPNICWRDYPPRLILSLGLPPKPAGSSPSSPPPPWKACCYFFLFPPSDSCTQRTLTHQSGIVDLGKVHCDVSGPCLMLLLLLSILFFFSSPMKCCHFFR